MTFCEFLGLGIWKDWLQDPRANSLALLGSILYQNAGGPHHQGSRPTPGLRSEQERDQEQLDIFLGRNQLVELDPTLVQKDRDLPQRAILQDCSHFAEPQPSNNGP